jgi:hypothetical protein
LKNNSIRDDFAGEVPDDEDGDGGGDEFITRIGIRPLLLIRLVLPIG